MEKGRYGDGHVEGHGIATDNVDFDLVNRNRRADLRSRCKNACYNFFSPLKVSEEGGNWTIKTSTTLKSMELKFKLDEEFEETTPDGREVKSVVKMEGNKLVTVQTAKKDGEKSTKSVREFNGDELVYTMEIIGGDITCVQKFKRM